MGICPPPDYNSSQKACPVERDDVLHAIDVDIDICRRDELLQRTALEQKWR